MENLESMAQNTHSDYISRRAQAVEFNRGYAIKAMAFFVAAANILGCGGGGGGGGGSSSTPPTGSLVVSPDPGKRKYTFLFDSSGSSAGSKAINRLRVDFDGDGTWDYTETPSSAPDGAFDLKTTHAMPDAKDITAKIEVTSDAGSDEATDDFDVGYGDDAASSADALAYSSTELTALGYTPNPNQQLQLLNPSTGQMVPFNALEGDSAGKKMYAVYNYDLTAAQKACLDAREAIGLNEPPVARLYETDSPDVIKGKLIAATSAAKAAALAGQSIAPAEIPAEEDSDDSDCWDEDCPKEECPEEPVQEVPEEVTEVF